MDESRFTRIETRVDEIKDDVAEIKAEQRVQGENIQAHTLAVQAHVAGDEKIITEIKPILDILPTLTEVIGEHQFNKEIKRRRAEKFKTWGVRIGTTTGGLTLIGLILKAFSFF